MTRFHEQWLCHAGERKQKIFSPLGTKLYFSCKFSERKFHCFVHQHGCLVTWLKTSNRGFFWKCYGFLYLLDILKQMCKERWKSIQSKRVCMTPPPPPPTSKVWVCHCETPIGNGNIQRLQPSSFFLTFSRFLKLVIFFV